jgi:hypothetical protein
VAGAGVMRSEGGIGGLRSLSCRANIFHAPSIGVFFVPVCVFEQSAVEVLLCILSSGDKNPLNNFFVVHLQTILSSGSSQGSWKLICSPPR